jgi:hypothetical protein
MKVYANNWNGFHCHNNNNFMRTVLILFHSCYCYVICHLIHGGPPFSSGAWANDYFKHIFLLCII